MLPPFILMIKPFHIVAVPKKYQVEKHIPAQLMEQQ